MIEFTLPVKTVSGMNVREYWRARAKRAGEQRMIACAYVKRFARDGDYLVTLTRISAGVLDQHDNLPAALKNVVDGIADGLGIKDNDQRVQWRYAQEKCKRGYFGVRVKIEFS
jgi:hypothetical protein